MELKTWLLFLQLFLLGLQISSGLYAQSQGIRPSKFWYGFPVWACLPITVIMLIALSLP